MARSLLSADCCPEVEPDDLSPSEGREPLVAAFRALGDPTRLAVFRLIAAQRDPICVCHIVDRFALTQPTISHHLKVLRQAGLVTVSRRGVWAYYAVNPRSLACLLRELADLLAGGFTTG